MLASLLSSRTLYVFVQIIEKARASLHVRPREVSHRTTHVIRLRALCPMRARTSRAARRAMPSLSRTAYTPPQTPLRNVQGTNIPRACKAPTLLHMAPAVFRA